MRWPALGALLLGITSFTTDAAAFCGFYVGKADSSLFNESSQVILARDGQRTTISMRNDYRGELTEFALVVPVPVVLKKDDVKVLDQKIFEAQGGKKAELQLKGEAQQQEMAHEKEMHQLDMTAKIQEVQIDGAIKQQEAAQRAQEGQQKLELQQAQGEQALRQGEQKMSIAERQAQMKRDMMEGGPPE